MAGIERYLTRIAASAERLSQQLQQKSNVPVDLYVNLADMQSFVAALTLDPTAVTSEDLSRIHLIRDGLHEALHAADLKQDGQEHSIEQLLGVFATLYVDVEQVLKLSEPTVVEANNAVALLKDTPHASVTPAQAIEVSQQANQVITNINITNRNIDVKIFNVDTINVVKEFKMNIKRFSASVFAIDLNFRLGVVFQGTIRFLNDGVDRILDDIKKFVGLMQKEYSTAVELVKSIDGIIDGGTRFVRLIGGIMKDLFGENAKPEIRDIKFVLQTKSKSPAMTSGAALASGDVVFGGRGGAIVMFSKRTNQYLKLPSSVGTDIQAVAFPRADNIAVGTPDGVGLMGNAEKNRTYLRSSFNERITALASTNWGAGGAIVSASKNGVLRRWTVAGLDAFRDLSSNRVVTQKVGKTVKALSVWGDKVVAVVDEKVMVFDELLEQQIEVAVDLEINAMCALTNDAVAIVGKGLLAEVNLARGAYNRMLTVSPGTSYIAVGQLAERVVVVATESGAIRAVDLNSGAEIGEIQVDGPVRGLTVVGNVVHVFGGPWRSDGNSLTKLLWEEITA